MEEQVMEISRNKLESMIRDSVSGFGLPANADIIIYNDDVDYTGEKEFDLEIASEDSDQIKFSSIEVHKGFPIYIKPHDIFKVEHVQNYRYMIDDVEVSLYVADRKYFKDRENQMSILKDIYINRVPNSEYSTNDIFSLDKKAFGANHLFQISDKLKEDNQIVICMQKGGRFEDGSDWGLLDVDLLSIVRSRLESFSEAYPDDEETAIAKDSIDKAISALNKRYASRKENGTFGKNS